MFDWKGKLAKAKESVTDYAQRNGLGEKAAKAYKLADKALDATADVLVDATMLGQEAARKINEKRLDTRVSRDWFKEEGEE